jgi:hypothetical protein
MNRLPPGIPEDVIMQFVTIVALTAIAVAFVAYVGTWISAWRQARRESSCSDSRPPEAEPGRAPGETRTPTGLGRIS